MAEFWREEHWGTEKDVEAKLVDIEDNRLDYAFKSASGSPDEWLRKVARDYPKLEFELKYAEEEMGYLGKVSAKKGKTVRIIM